MTESTRNRAEEIDVVGQDDSREQEKKAPEQLSPESSEQPKSADEQPDEQIETLEEAQARAEENWNKYLRVMAEMENVRKRGARELEYARKYGVERFARELLTVLDSLELSLEMGRESDKESGVSVSVESLLEGKKATLSLLLAAMKKFEIEELDPEGEVFDPQLHEAISTLPSDTVEPGSVVTVVQKGYRIYDRLLRPARVIVAAEKG